MSVDKLGKLFKHGVVVGGVVAGNIPDLVISVIFYYIIDQYIPC